MKNVVMLILIFILSMAVYGCEEENEMNSKLSFDLLSDVPSEKWEVLSKQKIYFGHQSVGGNILDGIRELLTTNHQIDLNIKETRDPNDFINGIFAHSRIGKNTDPESKIEDFASVIKSGVGNKADIVFLKFCYVDINAESDLNSIFLEYKNTLAELKKTYPDTLFIHCTVPILRKEKILPTNWLKNIIKNYLGKNTWLTHNISRNKYNEMLLNEYQGKDPIFDLALIESTRTDGSKEVFTVDGVSYASLVPEYTDDGGHLNAVGRKVLAEHLLVFLANYQ